MTLWQPAASWARHWPDKNTAEGRRISSPAFSLYPQMCIRDSVWTAGELMAYLSERGYSIVRHQLLGSSLAPLCCLMARKIPDERTAARQTAVRSAQLDHIKVKEE